MVMHPGQYWLAVLPSGANPSGR